MAFNGIHEPTLDAKNRLTVPAKFRPDLAGGLVLAFSLEPCLQVSATPEHERLATRALSGVTPYSAEARVLNRTFYGLSLPTELDSAGRIGIPKAFMEYAGLQKDVVIVGAGAYFEIWDRDRWSTYQPELIPAANQHIQTVAHPA